MIDDLESEVRIDDIRFLRSMGESEERIAERLKLEWGAYYQFLHRYMKGEPR